MRLAIISDIHGNLVALESVLAHVTRQSPDAVVNLGDCVTGPLWPRETAELLDTMALPTVRGNHDRWIVERPREHQTASMSFTRDALTAEQRARLATLPARLELDQDILAVHGTPDDDCAYLVEESRDDRLGVRTTHAIGELLRDHHHGLVLCGHSHQQHAIWAPGGRLVVNPGSVGGPRYADNPDPLANEAGSPHARYALADRHGDRWTVQLHVLAYNWSPVVVRARALGRTDWAEGFLKGVEP